MADPKVTVISESITVRESVEVALADRCALTHIAAADAAVMPIPHDADVFVCEVPAAVAGGKRASAQGVPVVWVASPGSPPPESGLAFPFLPESLRAAVRHAAATRNAPPQQTGERPTLDLDHPLIPRSAAAIAAKSVATGLPTLISGDSGSGARRLARQVHVQAGGGRFLAVPASQFTDEVVAIVRRGRCERITLCLDRIETMPVASMELLSTLLDEGLFAAAPEGPRLVCTAGADADAVVATARIDPELYYRLAVLPIDLPPLRTRCDDLPAIAAAVLARLAKRHAPGATPRLAEDAVARLCRYPWPGNLAELEAVLARSLVFRAGDVLAAADLVFDIAAAVRASSESPPRATRAEAEREPVPSTPGPRNSELDLLLQELAHELKNPMVTIKTVAQHLERLLDQESDQREMARMTGEAVDRMDRALENLLAFTRFEQPVPRETRLAEVVGECFEAMDAEVGARRILLDDRVDPGASVFVDRSQLVYALDNLVRAVLRAAGDGATLVVRSPLSRSGLVFEFPTSTASVTAALARWSDSAPPASGVAASIPFVFARALIERNGGSVRVRPGDGTTTVAVELPTGHEEAEEEDEEAAYLDR